MNNLLNNNKYKRERLVNIINNRRLWYSKKNLSKENENKLLSLKNLYKNRRCFIVGSSPSLRYLDLSKLKNEIVFTFNWGFRLKESGLSHSTFHLMSDINTFEEDDVMKYIPNDFVETFLIYSQINFNDKNKNVIYFDYIHHSMDVDKVIFQQDLKKPLIAYDTAVVHALQFALYMDFKKVFLIGVDLDFSKICGHAYVETQGEQKRQKRDSVRSVGVMLNGIKIASEIYKKCGKEIYNASPCGRVDCVPRVVYEDLFYD